MQNAKKQNPSGTLGGLTINLLNGICSEIYVQDASTNITACANNVYHEWMHNKSNCADGEDPDWVHTRGGGGLARAEAS